MSVQLVHIGFGNYLAIDRIIAIAMPRSAPIKRSIWDAKDKGLIIDLTDGRKTKSVIFTSSKYIVLSSLEPTTVNSRVKEI